MKKFKFKKGEVVWLLEHHVPVQRMSKVVKVVIYNLYDRGNSPYMIHLFSDDDIHYLEMHEEKYLFRTRKEALAARRASQVFSGDLVEFNVVSDEMPSKVIGVGHGLVVKRTAMFYYMLTDRGDRIDRRAGQFPIKKSFVLFCQSDIDYGIVRIVKKK